MITNGIKLCVKKLLGSLYFRKPNLTWDVESWLMGGNQGAEIVRILNNNEKVVNLLPGTTASSSLESVNYGTQITSFRRYIAKIYNAKINGSSGLISMPDGTFLIQPSWCKDILESDPAYFKRFQPRFTKMKGSWFSAILHWSGSYYHWMCDILPRVYEILNFLPSETRIIVPSVMEEWHWDSLRAIGINRSRCVCYSGDRPWVLEELYYAPPVAMAGDHEHHSMNWVRESIVSHFHEIVVGESTDRRFFISRCSTCCSTYGRQLINEIELYPILEKYGYKVVVPDSLSFAQQVKLFSTATHIVGTHGGGMTNLAWAPRGCRILEIYHPQTIDRRCYWSLSRTLGHHYFYLIGKNVVAADPNSPFLLDIELFKEGLHSLEK